MNRPAALFFAVAILLAATHRLPAPIVDEATPKPTPAVAKPKAKINATPKPKTVAILFAGNWTGTASGEIHAPLSPPNLLGHLQHPNFGRRKDCQLDRFSLAGRKVPGSDTPEW